MTYMSAQIQFLVSAPHPIPISSTSTSSSSSSSSYASASSHSSRTTASTVLSSATSTPPSMAGSTSRYSSSSSSTDGTASPSGSTRSRSTSSLSAYSSAESLDIPTGSYVAGRKADYGAPGVYTSLHTTVKILQECRLCLIHIPLHLYPHFVQAILSLILPLSPLDADHQQPDNAADDSDDDDAPDYPSPGRPSSAIKDFVNISVTPVECSVVCSRASVDKWFTPIIKTLETGGHRGDVMIGLDEFVAIQVDGEGLDAGQRVLDLTSPLALAGV